MAYITATPDAVVRGSFKSEEYSAKISVVVSCVNGAPAGSLNMSANGPNVWRITSTGPQDIDTEKSMLSDHVHVTYDNVTVKNETTGQKFTNCTAFLDVSEWPMGGGLIGLNVTMAVYSRSRTRPVFEWDGIFTGTMNVNQEVSCER